MCFQCSFRVFEYCPFCIATFLCGIVLFFLWFDGCHWSHTRRARLTKQWMFIQWCCMRCRPKSRTVLTPYKSNFGFQAHFDVLKSDLNNLLGGLMHLRSISVTSLLIFNLFVFFICVTSVQDFNMVFIYSLSEFDKILWVSFAYFLNLWQQHIIQKEVGSMSS